MTFVIPNLADHRNALLMANLTRDANSCLPDKQMALVLPADKLAAYQLAVEAAKARAEAAKQVPATVGSEAAYYWSAAEKFIRKVVTVAKMGERTAEQKSAKRGASAKLQGEADDLADLWRTVPAEDRPSFRKLALDGTQDTAIIPGIVITGTTKAGKKGKERRVKASLVQQYAIWVIQSEFEQDPELILIPWFEQLAALEEHLGKDIADTAPCLLDDADQFIAEDYKPDADRKPRPDDVDVTAMVRQIVARTKPSA
ncbi:hypothetical protein [uncultured Caulobacter sp.]|uniref:hypothetical protein n=1 Tax=uncultured Caulobacter sp. TaxID=158749 RepID=UPI00263028B6|nr:hypothetical protein [uncultured Caulobacter sp.]